MGWEQRSNRSYYYTKRREGDRVVSEYVGAGELATLVAELDEDRRIRRNHERALWQAEKESEHVIDAEIEHMDDIVRALTRAALLTSGHHTHKGHMEENA